MKLKRRALILFGILAAGVFLISLPSFQLPLTSDTEEDDIISVLRNVSTFKVPSLLTNDSNIEMKASLAEIYHGVNLHNEYVIFPYTRFTLQRIYLIDPGLGKRVVEKPIGYKKREIHEVVDYAITQLNSEKTFTSPHPRFTQRHFVEGISRTVPSAGTHYELFFTNSSNSESIVKLSIFQPFADYRLTHVTSEKSKAHIDLVLPLSGRLGSFIKFMKRFVSICVKHDGLVSLTVVYFGTEGMDEVKKVIDQVRRQHSTTNITLLTLTAETFSRARALQAGVGSVGKVNPLLFLCDVDIAFSVDFLTRCRKHTQPGQTVYFPIVFSLYNPDIVYRLRGKEVPSSEADLFVISKHTGWWRNFGYGMVCVYRSDLLAVGGFDLDERLEGWGMEDVHLYRKFLKSGMRVVRATEPGIFHVWHKKYCEPTLPKEQYTACIASKAVNEASHSQLGLLAFQDELDLHEGNN